LQNGEGRLPDLFEVIPSDREYLGVVVPEEANQSIYTGMRDLVRHVTDLLLTTTMKSCPERSLNIPLCPTH
jgi:hypothetical protein